MPQTYYGDQARPVAVGVSERGTFIARTYTHLLGAIALFLRHPGVPLPDRTGAERSPAPC